MHDHCLCCSVGYCIQSITVMKFNIQTQQLVHRTQLRKFNTIIILNDTHTQSTYSAIMYYTSIYSEVKVWYAQYHSMHLSVLVSGFDESAAGPREGHHAGTCVPAFSLNTSCLIILVQPIYKKKKVNTVTIVTRLWNCRDLLLPLFWELHLVVKARRPRPSIDAK